MHFQYHALTSQLIVSNAINIRVSTHGNHQLPMFTSAIVLLVNIWGTKKVADQEQDLKILKSCMEVLKELETRFVQSANSSVVDS